METAPPRRGDLPFLWAVQVLKWVHLAVGGRPPKFLFFQDAMCAEAHRGCGQADLNRACGLPEDKQMKS